MWNLNIHIPSQARVDYTIYKKDLYAFDFVTAADKKRIQNSIDKINWIYSLKTETVNIQPFDNEERSYKEVQVIQVQLKDKVGVTRLAELIMRMIPYPILLVFNYQETYAFYVAHLLKSKAEKDKQVLEELVGSDFVPLQPKIEEMLDFSKLRTSHFYDLYADWVSAVQRIKAMQMGLKIGTIASAHELTQQLKEVEQLERDLVQLRAQLRKETQFNRKVDLGLQIKKLENKLKEYKK